MPSIPEALSIAFTHHQRGELTQAEQIYRTIIENEPNHADAWHLMGVAAHQAGRHAEAVEHISRALAISGPNAIYLNHLGAAHATLQQHDDAERCLRQAAELGGNDPQIHFNLGALLVLRGKKTEAAESYRRAIALSPKFTEAQFNLGNLMRDEGHLEEAEHCYATALAARPQYNKAAIALANIQLRLKKLSAAESTYRLAMQADPKNADVRYWLGSLMQSQERLEEAAEMLQSAILLNPRHVEAQNNLGCIFRAWGRLDQAEQCFRLALNEAPNLAQSLSNLGSVLHDRKEYDAAADLFRRAIAAQPDFVQAHNNLGTVFQDQRRYEDALACYRKALEIDPALAESQVNLGSALQMQGHLDEAIEMYHRSIESDPNVARTHYCLGAALHTVGRDEEALAAYAEALRQKPDYAEAHYNRSFVHLARGDLAAGWQGYEWRLKCKDYKGRKFNVPRWDGAPLENRTLLVHSEQGLGDTLHFIRYLKLLQRQGSVYVEVPPALAPLLRASGFTGIIPGGSPLPRFDLEVPLLSLPMVLGTTLENLPAEVPYLAADPRLIKHWRGALRRLPGLKVGINWQGNRDYAYDHFRSIPLIELAPLAEVADVTLISLQKGPGTEQLAEVVSQFDPITLGDAFDTTAGPFMDTAAVISNLDLVITSDTAAAHLAGGLGVPVWLALAKSPEWRWLLEREDSPWYPTMRLFRQHQGGDWAGVFARMKQELAALVQKRGPVR